MLKNQFDIIIGNPPYHKKNDQKYTKTQAIWPDFINISLSACKTNGYIALIHPSGWRGPGGYKKIGNKLKSRQMKYLEMHDEKDGQKIFNAEVRYDWYILQNCPNITSTEIKDQTGKIFNINIKNMDIIPNCMFNDVDNLLAKNGEERVKILYNRGKYGCEKSNMSKEKTEVFQYPCVYLVTSKGEITLRYSNKNKGHFGLPKLIFSHGRISSANYFIDRTGEYGLTEFACGILDDIENFDNIYKAMRTKEFKKIMEACSIGVLSINKNVLSLFKKDFWKNFI